MERGLQHAEATARYNVYYGEGRDTYDIRGRVVHESIDHPSRILVDVREPEEYYGKLYAAWELPEKGGQRGGRIPSAVNILWTRVLEDDGTFKPVEAIQEIYSSQGVSEDNEVITYCVIGARSSHSWLVLK